MELFDDTRSLVGTPLAVRMRPRTLSDVVGQDHLLAERGLLALLLKSKRLPSLILWGPPGTGKTTIADVLAEAFDLKFARLSAVTGGVKDVRAVVEEARRIRTTGRRTLLFVDEIHRFNKSQQDALLPHVEDGTVTLVGATTENPSFEVNAALLSRCRVVTLRPLDDAAQSALIDRALSSANGLQSLGLSIHDDARAALISACAGDARRLLSSLEVAADLTLARVTTEITHRDVEDAVARRVVLYDKNGSAHFALASALIKSLRGSDPDASLYYAARMLEGGEDARFIFRRLVIFASEDIGNADPNALTVAVNAFHAYEIMGMPEGVHPMAQAVTYLACAPKSNRALTAFAAARADVVAHPGAEVPRHIQNAPTALMKSLGNGVGYQYPHDHVGHHVDETYLPDVLKGRRYYEPSNSGVEARIKARLATLRGDAVEPPEK